LIEHCPGAGQSAVDVGRCLFTNSRSPPSHLVHVCFDRLRQQSPGKLDHSHEIVLLTDVVFAYWVLSQLVRCLFGLLRSCVKNYCCFCSRGLAV